MPSFPLILIDIDGLRPDVFREALHSGKAPHLARIFGGPDLERFMDVPAVAPAPSITFCSQASLFTGAHPAQHGIPGNQFFDRFGKYSNGKPRHYAFDVGDTLAADDAVRVFTDGLASGCLQVPTIYENLAKRGLTSVVAGHMYARGASSWLRPSVFQLARLTKGGDLFGIPPEKFDREILEQALSYLEENPFPDVLTIYWMGIDHTSHKHGPHAQRSYLLNVIEPLTAELASAVRKHLAQDVTPLWALFSDHGQIEVQEDDRHSIRLAFPFEREMGPLFDALGLDVHDHPGEDPKMDALVAANGGLAHVYIRRRGGKWDDRPGFQEDILPVARAFWEAHRSGKYTPDLEGVLSGIFVRDVERDGWQANFQAYTSDGLFLSLEEFFASQPDQDYVDPVHRLNNLVSPLAGDLLLLSRYSEGFYFANQLSGVHGGLHPDDSYATMAFGWPDASPQAWKSARQAMQEAVEARCLAEGDRLPSTADLPVILMAFLEQADKI